MTDAPQFDVIVVGSGMTGGWAAKELTEKGLRVLVLERGRNIEPGTDYPGEHMPPWRVPFGGLPLRALYQDQYAIQSRSFAFDETTRQFWNNDRDNPYILDAAKPFHWIRADVVGGRSLLWGRQCYRWSDLDFGANARDGHGTDWPIRYRDIAPWYRHVERFIGVSGSAEGLPHLPDGDFLPPMEMYAAEKVAKHNIEARFPGRKVIIGRCANLTQPHLGRAACHYCGICARGCSTGSYFSSLSSTLPTAQATGNLSLIADSVVEGLDYDRARKRVVGVRTIDTRSKTRKVYTARAVFLCASTVGSVQILLNSRSEGFPRGLGNHSGTLGQFLMDHWSNIFTVGLMPQLSSAYFEGLRPNGVYVPRFRNLSGQDADADFVRGYGFQGRAACIDPKALGMRMRGFGPAFKQSLREPAWIFWLSAFGECLPRKENAISLDARSVDRFGIPQVRFSFQWSDNERKMTQDALSQGKAMLEAVGAQAVRNLEDAAVGGDSVHEMGGARMGNDPAQSVLNAWNQVHDIPNLYVADGACMASSSCVNPSLTYMALTARAADHASTGLRAGTI